jgi:hypothetical protein
LPLNEYRLITHWRVQASIEECFDIIAEVRERPRWWPSAYLDILEIQPGDERGVDKVVRATTKGRLPYILRWHFSVTEANRPDRIRIRAWGDFEGDGVWTFLQDGPTALITFEWRIKLNKAFLRWLSPLIRPIVELNHRWAMARGEESLRLEIDRRHTREQDLHLLPSPPPPTELPMKPIWIGLGVVAALVFFQRRRRRR